ncbi:molybdenum cofactor guanylyltransferase [Paenibacillus sp. GCM10023248]|uniref:molybdenum cofactor guanylyltransferase n=1 Tax=unclassified Paenibacillus TaxID=185978 RepID=UPI002378E3F4|nr:molybdenum cofactor guanylyltransferase [Paenibacillus sp. MAHUQ-63]MDD9271158.1 molybdenum cofactor guanylyltransferase [Paenibacillus sp. MAHUQ-63]
MITGVILAGGLNRRMGGKPKALLPVQGQPLLHKQLTEMSQITKQVVIVSNEPEVLKPHITLISPEMDVRWVSDVYVQKGPLSGIHAAAQAATNDWLWIVGCDMPFISSAAAQLMGQLCQEKYVDAVIPVLDGKVQPLHGVYSRLIGSEAEILLKQEKYRLMGLLDHIDWLPAEHGLFAQHQVPTDFAVNVNTPESYKDMLGNLS